MCVCSDTKKLPLYLANVWQVVVVGSRVYSGCLAAEHVQKQPGLWLLLPSPSYLPVPEILLAPVCTTIVPSQHLPVAFP